MTSLSRASCILFSFGFLPPSILGSIVYLYLEIKLLLYADYVRINTTLIIVCIERISWRLLLVPAGIPDKILIT